jgi:hypothetical protein
MIDGRTWTIAEFDEYLVRHPLVRHLTGRLVWLAETDGSTTAFRIAEDRTRTDVDEEELNLPDDAVIRLAHPVHLGDQVEAWTEIFADYEILQPFEQLGRTVMAFTPEELRTGRIRRFEGVEIATVRVFGLTHKGWHRTDRRHDEPGVFYPYPGGGFLLFELEHGISFREPGDRQAVKSVRLSHDPSFETDGDGHPTDIDPVAASESLASLARLAEAG